MKTTVSNSKLCSATSKTAAQSNINIKDSKGPLVFTRGDVTQDIDAAFSLACIQNAQYKNDMASALASAVTQEIFNKYSADDQAQMASAAESAANAGFGISLINPSSSDSSTNTKYNLTATNKINTTLQNVINNRVEQDFNANDIQACGGSMDVTAEANTNLTGLAQGAIFTLGNTTQKLKSSFEQKCVQESQTVTKTLSKMKDTFDSISKVLAEMQSKTATSSNASGSAKSSGIENVLDSAFTGVSSIFGQFMWPLIIIAIVIIVIGAFAYFVLKDNPEISSAVASNIKSRGLPSIKK